MNKSDSYRDLALQMSTIFVGINAKLSFALAYCNTIVE